MINKIRIKPEETETACNYGSKLYSLIGGLVDLISKDSGEDLMRSIVKHGACIMIHPCEERKVSLTPMQEAFLQRGEIGEARLINGEIRVRRRQKPTVTSIIAGGVDPRRLVLVGFNL